jgi:hypothetical protein
MFASPSKPQLTNIPFHSTVRHLNRLGPNSLTHQPLSHLAQPRRRINLTPILARRILGARPKHLRSRSSTGPNHPIDINGVGLLGPHMRFAA